MADADDLREQFLAEARRRNLNPADALHQAMTMWLRPPKRPRPKVVERIVIRERPCGCATSEMDARVHRKLARHAGVTQKEVAASLGVRYWQFVKWVNGMPLPATGDEAERFVNGLAQLFDVTPDQVRETRCRDRFQI